MKLTETEQKILLKMYDTCFLNLSDDINLRLLYHITNKNYLWKTIKELEKKDIIKSYIEHKYKFVSLTKKGQIITTALNIIRIQ